MAGQPCRVDGWMRCLHRCGSRRRHRRRRRCHAFWLELLVFWPEGYFKAPARKAGESWARRGWANPAWATRITWRYVTGAPKEAASFPIRTSLTLRVWIVYGCPFFVLAAQHQPTNSPTGSQSASDPPWDPAKKQHTRAHSRCAIDAIACLSQFILKRISASAAFHLCGCRPRLYLHA